MAEGGNKISEEEIFECLKSLNVPIQKNDLKSPTREFIVRVFECFLKDLQIDIASPELRTWEATNHIENAEIYEDAELLIMLTMCMNHIFQPSPLNITIKDIVEPKPKRTKKILNYIIIFWNYYLKKYSRFCAIEETYENEKKQAEDLVIQIQSLEERHNAIVDVLKNMQPSKAELLNAVEAKQEKLSNIEKQKADLLAEYNAVKTKITSIGNQIGSTEVSIVTAKERIEELGTLILSSPERISTEILRLKDRIKAEDLKIKEKEAQLKEMENKLQIQEQNIKAYENSETSLNSIMEEMQVLKNIVKNIVDDQEKIEKEEDQVKTLQKELHQKEEWKVHQDQKSLKVVLNSKMQKEALTTALETLKREEAKEKKALGNIKATTKELEEHIESESNFILEIFKNSKEANTKSKERKTQHMLRLKEYENSFKSDCDELEKEIKMKFPDVLD